MSAKIKYKAARMVGDGDDPLRVALITHKREPGADQSAVIRPAGITTTAWLWIVMGGLMIFSGVLGGFAYTMMRDIVPPLPPSMNIPTGSSVMMSIFQHSRVVLFRQCIVAVAALGGGIALLRLKPWARTTIEALSWPALLNTTGFGILWIFMWISMSGQIPKGDVPTNSDTFQLTAAVAGVIINAAFAVPLWIMIRYFHGGKVRSVIANARRAKV